VHPLRRHHTAGSHAAIPATQAAGFARSLALIWKPTPRATLPLSTQLGSAGLSLSRSSACPKSRLTVDLAVQ